MLGLPEKGTGTRCFQRVPPATASLCQLVADLLEAVPAVSAAAGYTPYYVRLYDQSFINYITLHFIALYHVISYYIMLCCRCACCL